MPKPAFKHPQDFNTAAAPLLISEDRALARGLELCDDASVEALIAAIREMRKPTTYSNEDGDRRGHFHGVCDGLRRLGKTPLLTTHERLERLGKVA